MRSFFSLVMPIAGIARKAYRFVFRPRTIGVKVLLTHGGEILFVRHTYEPGVYGLPGGGIKAGEDPLGGLRREVSEELGLRLGDARCLGTIESDAEYNRDTVHVFSAELADRDALVPDPVEIAALLWAPSARLPPVGPVTEKILRFALDQSAQAARR